MGLNGQQDSVSGDGGRRWMNNLQTDPHRAACDGRWTCQFLLSTEPTPKLSPVVPTRRLQLNVDHARREREPVDRPALLNVQLFICLTFRRIRSRSFFNQSQIRFCLRRDRNEPFVLGHMCMNELDFKILIPLKLCIEIHPKWERCCVKPAECRHRALTELIVFLVRIHLDMFKWGNFIWDRVQK